MAETLSTHDVAEARLAALEHLPPALVQQALRDLLDEPELELIAFHVQGRDGGLETRIRASFSARIQSRLRAGAAGQVEAGAHSQAPAGPAMAQRAEATEEEVLVVAAGRYALQEYLELGAYFCQPQRSFRPVSRLAFYAGGRIARHVPLVLGCVESVPMSEAGVQAAPDLAPATRRRLLALVEHWRKIGRSGIGEPHKVVFLSRASSAQTSSLPREVRNDLVSPKGRPVPFVRGHRYVPLGALQAGPQTTSELLDLAARPAGA